MRKKSLEGIIKLKPPNLSNPNYNKELKHLHGLLQRENLDGLIARYPLRQNLVFGII